MLLAAFVPNKQQNRKAKSNSVCNKNPALVNVWTASSILGIKIKTRKNQSTCLWNCELFLDGSFGRLITFKQHSPKMALKNIQRHMGRIFDRQVVKRYTKTPRSVTAERCLTSISRHLISICHSDSLMVVLCRSQGNTVSQIPAIACFPA